ncbi:hypothetical protein O6H91_22G038700 [Diphasiastrum complanatum]|uniref:Uncharacterized protein n=1 Tax=Diphasiastrum complanatum TaxID=34168 RepID=A0ACC2AEM2_DIPCM|nr:hypothetical protein O6H91_22G038700 [Diphasiastrum complanatum]
MASQLINANPVVHERKARSVRQPTSAHDDLAVEPIDSLEVFDHVRDIKDPEHPYTLEQLNVVSEDSIAVDDKRSHVLITFTPTVEHCSMATLIGLCIRVKLMQSLPPRFKIDIKVSPGSHASEVAANRDLLQLSNYHPKIDHE